MDKKYYRASKGVRAHELAEGRQGVRYYVLGDIPVSTKLLMRDLG